MYGFMKKFRQKKLKLFSYSNAAIINVEYTDNYVDICLNETIENVSETYTVKISAEMIARIAWEQAKRHFKY